MYVGGDLYVKDDITYDQVSGREINITGLGTIAYFHATTAQVSGASTFTGVTTTGSKLYVGDGLAVVGVTTLASAGGITTTGGALYGGSTLHVAGLSSVSDVVSSGIVTADYFYGDGSNLSNVDAASGGAIGVASEGTYIGSGTTFINFASSNGTAWQVTAPSSGVATVTVTPGASIGLAIALGG